MKALIFFATVLVSNASVFADNSESSSESFDPIFALQLQIERIDKILSQNSATLRQGFDIDSGRSIREMIEMERAEKVAKQNELKKLRAEIRTIEDIFADPQSLRFYERMMDPASDRSGLEMLLQEFEAKNEKYNALKASVQDPR